MEYNEELLSPLDYYKNTLKNEFLEGINKYIEGLKEESKIDTDHNKKEVEKYKELQKNESNISLKHKLYSTVFYIFLAASIIFAAVAFLNEDNRILYILICLACAGVAVYSYMTKKKVKEDLNNAMFETHKQLERCFESMDALNDLLCSGTTHDLIRKTVPFIHLDRNFNKERFEQLRVEYDLPDNDDVNSSALELISGDILGNPFVFKKTMEHAMGTNTYTGSRTVSYKETYTDNEGKTKTRTVTETLYASVEKPMPKYSELVELIYGCDAASRLSFSRNPSAKATGIGIFKIDTNMKELKKKIKSSPDFVPMADEEFDAQFGALDRDNETEFRVLFTPIAIENMKKLMNDDLYGDDFRFEKLNKLNYILSYHAKQWKINTSNNKKRHYDFEEFKKYFSDLNIEYFQHFYYMLLPILSIPIYQQYKSKEYIYGDIYKHNYNGYLTETLANEMPVENFCHPSTETRTILKTKYVSSTGKVDSVKVSAYSYKIEGRVEHVSVRAGNGSYYDVPVPWDEYIPVYNEGKMTVSETELSEREIEKGNEEKDTLICYFKNNIIAYI